MGNYISRTDVERRLHRAHDALYTNDGAIDTDLIDADIEEAEGIVDGYLSGRYTVPVSGASTGLLKSLCLALLEELAYTRGANTKVPDKTKDRADNARAMLSKIAAGTVNLGAATVPAERPGATGSLIVEADDTAFTREDLESW